MFYALCILGCFTVAEQPTLGGLGAWLGITLLGILAAKLLIEGPSKLPGQLHSWGGLRCLGKPFPKPLITICLLGAHSSQNRSSRAAALATEPASCPAS